MYTYNKKLKIVENSNSLSLKSFNCEFSIKSNTFKFNNNSTSKKRIVYKYLIIIALAIIGIMFQPLYIAFYLTYGFLWVIKEYGWWCFIADYNV